MHNPAVSVHGLGKMYKLYSRPGDKVLDALGANRLLFWRKRYYREFWALRGLDLDVRRGERIGIIGENGAGKSTLLKIICGSVTPTEGTVSVSGRVQALMEIGTGFHPEFTGRQNIHTALSYQGLTPAEIFEAEEEIIDFTELESFIEQPLKTYSAGMYARLAFATATVVEPEILIIDEILGAGDAYFSGKCVERMLALTKRAGTTVLFVSHDVSAVQRLCTTAAWIKSGRVHMLDRTVDVVREYLGFMQQKEDLRLRAREMRLSRRNARVVVTDDDLFRKFLFRLKTPGPQPQRAHEIHELALHINGRAVAAIEVGEPMDNGEACPNHLIDDPATTNWGPPHRRGDRHVRSIADHGGRDGHAPFLLSLPSYLLEGAGSAELHVRHVADPREPVYVEHFAEGSYRLLGELQGDGSEGPATTVFRVPIAKGAGKDDSDDLDRSTAPAPVDGTSAETEQATSSTSPPTETLPESKPASDCRIRGLDILLDGRQSARMVPVGSRLSVRLRYEAAQQVFNPVFAITFHRLDGTQMDHKNNRLCEVDAGWVQGRGEAVFTFDPLRLGVGEYVITAAILKCFDADNMYEMPPCYDRHDRKYCLTVFADNLERKNFGIVLQECRFELVEESPLQKAG